MRDRYKKPIVPLGYMDLKLYTDLIEQLEPKTEIDFHKDGEPLLHPYIAWMVKYAKNNGMFTHVVTNGILLGKQKEKIVDSGLDLLTVSIVDDIPTDSINEFMNYKGSRSPITQLKCYGEHKELPKADRVIQRLQHNWTDDAKRKNQTPCSKLIHYQAINWDGSWALCCVDYKREFSLFNIKEVSRKRWMDFCRMIYNWQAEGLFLAPCKTCNYWGG
jgi:hypothetical protein